MKIKIHLKVFIFLIVFLITHQIKTYGIIMLFALIHELGHLCIGIILGFKPMDLDIMPYGLSINFEVKCKDYNKRIKKGNILNIKKLIIALAGPITNLIIAIIFLLFDINLFNIEREVIVYANILIGMFNLIPIYPLDGGRIIKEILHINLGLVNSNKYTNLIAKISICILTFISSLIILYIHNIGIIIMLAYLWYLTIIENKKYERKKQIYDLIKITE